MEAAAVKRAAEAYLPQMTRFLRDLIAIPSESCEEEGVIRRTIREMEALGFDKAWIDPEGNALGYMGDGEKIIAFDGHIDTVGIGNRDNWTNDPYEGYETDDIIYGRGGSDQEGGVVSAVYGAKIMKDLGLIPAGYKILVTATVQEEDCDGLCWQYIHNEDGITPEFVVSTEPTDGGIYRGHRGRMEIRVDVAGVSCHGSAPERGDNAIYKMAEIVSEVKQLNENGCAETDAIKGLVKMLEPEFNPEHYEDARFLGRGTCAVSQIFYTSPSRCAVADSCAISIDRRMTAGETWDSCLKAIADAHKALYGDKRVGHPDAMALRHRPLIDKWTFSTNGVSIQGRYGIPCVGFGPGAESQAHAPNEITWKEDLVRCAAVYALAPSLYKGKGAEDVCQFRAGKTNNDIK